MYNVRHSYKMNSYYTQYYLRQEGRGLSDIGALYHSPLINQRGRGGVGSFFSGFLKYLKPLVSSGLNALKSQALKSGSAILDDVGNKPLKEILKEQGKAAIQNLAVRGVDKLKRMQAGQGQGQKYIKRRKTSNKVHSAFKLKQGGKGKSRKKKKTTLKNKKQTNSKKSKTKTRFVDIFNN